MPSDRPVNPRLAHLLPKAEVPAANGGTDAGRADGATDTTTRLSAVEGDLATLVARLDGLQAVTDRKLDSLEERLLRAVGHLLDERLGRR